ncbi:MAG: hypothetical protein ACI82F_001414, partial [Planctomycetota bacterium]
GEVLIKRGIINVKDWIQYVERARLQVGMGGGKTTGSKLGLPIVIGGFVLASIAAAVYFFLIRE